MYLKSINHCISITSCLYSETKMYLKMRGHLVSPKKLISLTNSNGTETNDLSRKKNYNSFSQKNTVILLKFGYGDKKLERKL